MSNRKPVIVIDPGHGGKNKIGGSSPNNAVGTNGLLEKNLTLDVSKRLQALLADTADVSLTRTDDTNLSLTDRAKVAAERRADVFVSLHFNGFSDARVDGSEVWVARQASSSSRGLAKKLLSYVVGATGVSDRGVRESDFGVLLHHAPTTAACLVETAFLTNPAEARRLEDESYRQKIASALSEGVSAYLKSTQLPAVPATLDYEAAGWGAALSGTSPSPTARLEWQDQTVVRGSHGQNTLFLLTSGSPEGGPAIFNLKVTNTSNLYNLKSTMIKVRLLRREGDGTFTPIPLTVDEKEYKCTLQSDIKGDYKCIPSHEIESEKSRIIPLNIQRSTLLRAYDPHNQFMRLEVEFHWKEEGVGGRSFHFNRIDKGFYLVQPIEVLFGSMQYVREVSLDDPQYSRFWTTLWEHQFTNYDVAPRTVVLNGQSSVSRTRTDEIALSRSITTTVGEQRTVETTNTSEMSASIGLKDVIELGLSSKESVSVKNSASWSSSVARQFTDSVRNSTAFTESFSKAVTITTFIAPEHPTDKIRVVLYPIFKLFKVKVVKFDGPNRYGQATGRTEIGDVAILQLSHWADKPVKVEAAPARQPAQTHALDFDDISYAQSADEWNPIVCSEIEQYLNRFINIPVTVAGATVNVRPPYFINRDNARKRLALENRRTAPAEDRAIFGDSAFAAARVGKGSIEQYQSILERAVTGGRVQAAGGRSSPNAEDLRAWLVKYGLGIDCSGFVTQALNTGMQRVFGHAPSNTERLDPLNINSAALKGGARNFTAIARPDQLRPGDTMHKEGHIRVITDVENTSDGHVKFRTAESSSAQDIGPIPNVWRYVSRDRFTGLQKETQRDWNGSAWRDYNEGRNTYGRYQPLARFVDANSPARAAQTQAVDDSYLHEAYAVPFDQQPIIGWPDAASGSLNASERTVSGVRRLPIAGLRLGNQERAPRQGTSESAAGRCVVLIPSEMDLSRPVEVLLHLHGYNMGYRSPAGGQPRDVSVELIPQQLTAAARNMIVVLPQGTATSGFGNLDPNAYLDEVFAALSSLGVWGSGSPQRGSVILSGHSGAGGPIAGMLRDTSRLPRPLQGVFLFDAINVRSGKPVTESGELRIARAWVAARLQQDLSELQRRTDPAAQRSYTNSSLRLRGYHTPGHYANLYRPLISDIDQWFSSHQRELQALDPTASQRLRENYRLIPLASMLRPGETASHDRILALGRSLQDALGTLPAAAPAQARTQAYEARTMTPTRRYRSYAASHA